MRVVQIFVPCLAVGSFFLELSTGMDTYCPWIVDLSVLWVVEVSTGWKVSTGVLFGFSPGEHERRKASRSGARRVRDVVVRLRSYVRGTPRSNRGLHLASVRAPVSEGEKRDETGAVTVAVDGEEVRGEGRVSDPES
jgi:hypothetical protein